MSRDLALPPADLRTRVAGTDNVDWFLQSGRQSVADLDRALAAVGRRYDSFKEVLDFGCGCGRVDRWLLDRRVSLTGLDIDPQLIGWCQEHLLGARFEVGPHLPPTRFSDESFDLVVNHSVFTHLDEHRQDLWLQELHRVAVPGGIVVLSFSGPKVLHHYEETHALPTRRSWVRYAVERHGLLFYDDHDPSAPFPEFYRSTIHSPWYVIERWQRWFDLLAYLPANNLDFQDAVVMSRPIETRTRVPVVKHRGPNPLDWARTRAITETLPPNVTAVARKVLPEAVRRRLSGWLRCRR